MAELTIQFDAEPGVDTDALAKDLQTQLSGIPAIEDVQAEVMESRDLALAATAIMAFIATAPKVIDDATRIVNSLKALIEATKGLKSAVVELRGRKIPVSQLKPEDIVSESAK